MEFDPTIKDVTGRDCLGVARQVDFINNETKRNRIMMIIEQVTFPVLSAKNFSNHFIECKDENDPIHEIVYFMCPLLKEESLK